eukprot:6575631-Prymnesium_polylepis.1
MSFADNLSVTASEVNDQALKEPVKVCMERQGRGCSARWHTFGRNRGGGSRARPMAPMHGPSRGHEDPIRVKRAASQGRKRLPIYSSPSSQHWASRNMQGCLASRNSLLAAD